MRTWGRRSRFLRRREGGRVRRRDGKREKNRKGLNAVCVLAAAPLTPRMVSSLSFRT